MSPIESLDKAADAARQFLNTVETLQRELAGSKQTDPLLYVSRFSLEEAVRPLLTYVRTQHGNYTYMKVHGKHYTNGRPLREGELYTLAKNIRTRLIVLKHLNVFNSEVEAFLDNLDGY